VLRQLLPAGLGSLFSVRAAIFPEGDSVGDGVFGRKQDGVCALANFREAGAIGNLKVTATIIEKDGHEMRIEERGDNEIGEFVSVHILRGDLETTGWPEYADCGLRAGAKLQVERILGIRDAVASHANRSQIGLAIAVEIGDGKMSGAWGNGNLVAGRCCAIWALRNGGYGGADQKERAETEQGNPKGTDYAGCGPMFHVGH